MALSWSFPARTPAAPTWISGDLYKAGVDAGARRLCFCDTVGVLTPEIGLQIFSRLSALPAPISIHCHNDFGMATANTVASLSAGAAQAHVTVNGIGERSGNASLEEVVMTLESLYAWTLGSSARTLSTIQDGLADDGRKLGRE